MTQWGYMLGLMARQAPLGQLSQSPDRGRVRAREGTAWPQGGLHREAKDIRALPLPFIRSVLQRSGTNRMGSEGGRQGVTQLKELTRDCAGL